MVNPKDAKNARKQENFGILSFFEDILVNTTKLAMVIGVIVVIIIALFLFMHYNKQNGTGIMQPFSDTSPMAPLTATPSN